MRGKPFTTAVDGGELSGWVTGSGAPVLLLHGGPGMSCEYLDDIADDVGDGYEVAGFQQRGIPVDARRPIRHRHPPVRYRGGARRAALADGLRRRPFVGWPPSVPFGGRVAGPV